MTTERTPQETVERLEVEFSDGTFGAILPEGTRVRSRVAPELTGYIKHWEWNKPGVLSPIPYCIGWDDSERAHALLGFLAVYARDIGVEPIP